MGSAGSILLVSKLNPKCEDTSRLAKLVKFYNCCQCLFQCQSGVCCLNLKGNMDEMGPFRPKLWIKEVLSHEVLRTGPTVKLVKMTGSVQSGFDHQFAWSDYDLVKQNKAEDNQ